MKHQNRYPVIYISLKDMRKPTFERQVNKFKAILQQILIQYNELLHSEKLDESEKALIRLYKDKIADIDDIEDSLLNISICLEKHYGKKVVILIDEYDVPLQYAYLQGYYYKMVNLLRNVVSAVLKTNSSLRQGILTGCLRIAKESIFTKLNNFSVYGITEEISAQYFGFTPYEVKQMLKDYDLLAYEQDVKEWYDGYLFGNLEMYELINKGSIIKKVKPDLTYREMDDTNNIYSFLLFTGYLKIGKTIDRLEDIYELLIPNNEVRKVYTNQFEQYFEEIT